ncbi:hypothetical protein BpHYR1_050314 [Brachionus plicatilis]|uniref:TFIIS central domain-containing protein n=1 Tax=Brachionus plicatilis TaxID=10195 RepID=A0A3M7SCK9_BRAPC|nr:hypothetical protein BpHYR1_050314 [Brachionus plicatilis]
MSDSSKTPKASTEKDTYDKLYSLDYNDINNDFYHLVDNDLLMQVVESKVKKSCPSSVDYIVLSDSDEESQTPPKAEQNKSSKNLQTEQFQNRDKNPSFLKSCSNDKNEKENLEMILPKKIVNPCVKKSDSSEKLVDKHTQAEVSSTKSSSPLVCQSSSNEKLKDKSSDVKTTTAIFSSPLVYQSSSNEKLKDKSSDVKTTTAIFSSPLVYQSSSNEKLKDKSSDVKTTTAIFSSPLVCQSSSNEKLKDKSSEIKRASTKCSSPSVYQSSSNEKTEKKNLETLSVEKNMISLVKTSLSSENLIDKTKEARVSSEKCASASIRRSVSNEKIAENNSSLFNNDSDDDFPLSPLVGGCKSSEDESDSDELSEKFIKKEWCICANSQVKENLKTCDKCGQWFHILCAADAKTIKKVQSGVKVSLIDDFKCLLCRNDREAMKKFDPKMIEQRIKLRNERLSLRNSDEEKINRIYLVKTDDQEARKTNLKKSLNEKTQLVKDRTQEQKKTKFLTHMESSDKSRIKKKSTSMKFFPPKQVIQKKAIHDTKKLATTSTTNKSNSPNNRPCQSHTPKRSLDLVKNAAPSERKTKLISTPTTTIAHRTVKVTSDRETTRHYLFKSFKDRVEHAGHLDITDQHIDSLCHQIEQQIHNQFSETNEYSNRVRVIRMNVNDKANKTFFKKILTGQIKPDQLPLMDKNEMKDDDLRRQDEEFLRQDLKGRIEQSNELNEDIRKKQEALRVRKGIDDDLTTLGTFTSVTDLNNNDKVTEEHSEPVEQEQPTNQAFVQDEEPNVAQNEKKRKHDSDFESDTEVQPLAKISKNIVPQLDISLSHIPILTKPEFKISSDITWSGSLNLNAPDMIFKLRVHMINLNDLDPTSNRFRLLETFKQRLTLKAITDFKLVDVPHINVWNMNVNHYLAFKFEPNMNQKSLLQPQYIPSLKEYESSEVLFALYKKMKPSTFTYSIQLPESLQDIAEKIILCPVRKSQSGSEQELDANLKDRYNISLKRSVDSVLGFLIPRVLDDAKKSSPNQAKTSSRKEEVRDPRMRKSVKTSPNQEAEQYGSCSLRSKVSEDLSKESPGQIGNQHESGHPHKVISLDVYKQKHKLTSDRIECVAMDIDTPEQPPFNAYSKNFILIDTILATIGPDTSQLNKLAILHNMSNMSILKSLNKQEIDELTQKYANSLPEFVDMVQKSSEGEKVEEKQSENGGDGQNGLLPERTVQNCGKMVLPPKEKWQGSTKESFENLLRLHKISKERKSNGLSHDLTFESQNWQLDERNFKPLDENVLNKNVCSENERKVSDSETNVSSDGMSSCGDVAPAKRIRATARKSVSGIVRRFKVAD